MKTGRSFESLASEVERMANSSKDYIADTRSLHFSDKGSLLIDVADQTLALDVTNHAHGQIASRLDIPKVYYDRLLEKAPELLARNVNHWFASNPERRLIRTVDGKGRAFLSERYRPLDYFDLLQAIYPRLRESGAEIVSCELTDTRLYIKAIASRLVGQVKVGDVVKGGIAVSNSEVGSGSVKIEPFIERLVCANGMIVPDAGIRKYHVGRGKDAEDEQGASEFFKDETRQADDRAFWLKVRDTVDATLTQANLDKVTAKMAQASGVSIKADPVKVVEKTAKRFAWTQDEQGAVLNSLVKGGDLSQFGLVNAITDASKNVADYDRATDMERQGGEVLALTGENWKGLVSI